MRFGKQWRPPLHKRWRQRFPIRSCCHSILHPGRKMSARSINIGDHACSLRPIMEICISGSNNRLRAFLDHMPWRSLGFTSQRTEDAKAFLQLRGALPATRYNVAIGYAIYRFPPIHQTSLDKFDQPGIRREKTFQGMLYFSFWKLAMHSPASGRGISLFEPTSGICET